MTEQVLKSEYNKIVLYVGGNLFTFDIVGKGLQNKRPSTEKEVELYLKTSNTTPLNVGNKEENKEIKKDEKDYSKSNISILPVRYNGEKLGENTLYEISLDGNSTGLYIESSSYGKDEIELFKLGITNDVGDFNIHEKSLYKIDGLDKIDFSVIFNDDKIPEEPKKKGNDSEEVSVEKKRGRSKKKEDERPAIAKIYLTKEEKGKNYRNSILNGRIEYYQIPREILKGLNISVEGSSFKKMPFPLKLDSEIMKKSCEISNLEVDIERINKRFSDEEQEINNKYGDTKELAEVKEEEMKKITDARQSSLNNKLETLKKLRQDIELMKKAIIIKKYINSLGYINNWWY